MIEEGEATRRSGVASARTMIWFGLLALTLSAVAPGALTAQGGEWPTLSGAGLEYLSRSGSFQVSLSGQLDFETLHVGASWSGLLAREEGDPVLPDSRVRCTRCHVGMGNRGSGGGLSAPRLRVFADVFAGDHVYSLIEFRTDRGPAPSDGEIQARLEQAYLRIVSERGAIGVQVGRFASPFGSYPLRHLTTVDPFIRPPLAHDYRTVMSRTVVPRDAPFLLEWKHAHEFFRRPGTPPVWEVPYQWGAMAMGRIGPLNLRIAAMNSATSSNPEAWKFDWDRFEDPSWVFGARTRLSASLDVGLSYSKGPWLEEPIAGSIRAAPTAAAGADPPSYRDFDQEIMSADLTFARGPVVLRAEAMLDKWDVPNVADTPTDRSYSAELQWDLVSGLFLGLRGGHIDFRPLDDGLGAASPLTDGTTDWDNDVTRYELSLGYRVARNAGVLFSAYDQIQKHAADADSRLYGLRLWWAF